jgi:phosphocarrier protein
MASVRLSIVNELGLHARAAAKFVQVASGFDSDVWITKGNSRVNGKSIMGILTLAAARGEEVYVEADGSDENDAVAALTKLVKDGFGEAAPKG